MKFKSKVSSPIIASVIIFILGLTATYVTWNESRDKTFQRTETQQKEITNSLESGIRTKTTAIEESVFKQELSGKFCIDRKSTRLNSSH